MMVSDFAIGEFIIPLSTLFILHVINAEHQVKFIS